MPLEAEDYIGLFDSEEEELPVVSSVASPRTANGEKASGVPASITTDDEWQSDPFAVKLEKIRAAVLNSKTASEVMASCGTMQMGDWLDLVVKLSPKNVQVTGGLSFKHMLAELGPIDKEAYRPKLSEPVVEAEYEEMK